eukprot:UN06375
MQSYSENSFDGKRVPGHSKKPTWTETKGPLSGNKLLEFSHGMAGPIASFMLADQGYVMKLEVEGNLDPIREFGPTAKECKDRKVFFCLCKYDQKQEDHDC